MWQNYEFQWCCFWVFQECLWGRSTFQWLRNKQGFHFLHQSAMVSHLLAQSNACTPFTNSAREQRSFSDVNTQRVRRYVCICIYIHIYIYTHVGPSGSMWQFWVFSGLNSESSLFYSVLRRPAMFEMPYHKPIKCSFLQYLQLLPAKFLYIKHLISVNSILHYVFWDLSGGQNCHIKPEGTNHIYKKREIYIYAVGSITWPA